LKSKIQILVIGGTGFIGYHLITQCLKKKWSVVSFSKNPPRKIRFSKKIKYIEGDLSKKKELNKIRGKFDYVVNLGGYVDHSNKMKTYDSHFKGCKNLSNFFLSKKIKLFVQIGSSGEYGSLKSPHKETSVGNPQSVYSKAKYYATNHLLKLYKKKNFPVTILRLYQAYGPRQDSNRLIPIVINSCLKNKKFPCSDGKQFRDFVHVNDVVNAILKSLKSKKALGQIINIGSGKPKKVKNLINFLVKIIKGGKPMFGKIKLRKDEILKIYPKISKAKKTLNWYPRINFTKGLNETIKYYKKSNNFDK
jgi:UDP-glucose 4-epimerase